MRWSVPDSYMQTRRSVIAVALIASATYLVVRSEAPWNTATHASEDIVAPDVWEEPLTLQRPDPWDGAPGRYRADISGIDANCMLIWHTQGAGALRESLARYLDCPDQPSTGLIVDWIVSRAYDVAADLLVRPMCNSHGSLRFMISSVLATTPSPLITRTAHGSLLHAMIEEETDAGVLGNLREICRRAGID